MNRFKLVKTALDGLSVIERHVISDSRGGFARLFCSSELHELGWTMPVSQINHTVTKRQGTVRGLHFQYPPYAESKLVNCIRGTIWDVAVDVRMGSPTFLQHHAEVLSLENGRSMLIPVGFAHGFQALSDDVELIYVHSAPHAPDHEGGLSPLDPDLNIPWPQSVADLSMRDRSHPLIAAGFKAVEL